MEFCLIAKPSPYQKEISKIHHKIIKFCENERNVGHPSTPNYACLSRQQNIRHGDIREL